MENNKKTRKQMAEKILKAIKCNNLKKAGKLLRELNHMIDTAEDLETD